MTPSTSSPNPTTVWQATGDDVHAALELLRVLPRRHPTDARMLRRAFDIALDGVSGVILRMAVEAVLQFSLEHGFMPSPSELRGECNRLLSDRRRALLAAGAFAEMPTDEQVVAYLAGQTKLARH
jgi:hypothetical protein